MISDFIPRNMLPSDRKVNSGDSAKSESSQEWQDFSDSTLDLSNDQIESVQTQDFEALLQYFDYKILVPQRVECGKHHYLNKINYMQDLQENMIHEDRVGRSVINHQFQILYDMRTTIMIKNIPRFVNPSNLQEKFNKQFKFQYDFVYLPYDHQNQCNMGYAFINLLSPMLVQQFYQLYHGKRWSKNSDKICQLRYANQQGKRDIINQLGLVNP